MRITNAEFAVSAFTMKDYPRDGLPEVVFIGRSNVGKSTLINTLVRRKRLAKTSSTPGKTRSVNFYRINEALYFVDLPGFGYAKVPADVKRSWNKMIDDYLTGRTTVRGAVVLLDVRRDPGDTESGLFRWLKDSGLPVITVITKTDKFSSNKLSVRVREIKGALDIEDPVLFSAVKGRGRDELLKRIDKVLGRTPPPA